MSIPKDKLQHIGVCSMISLSVGALLYALHSPLLIMIISSLLCSMMAGLGKEFGDRVNPYNKWDWKDFIADCIGAIVGTSAGSLLYLI